MKWTPDKKIEKAIADVYRHIRDVDQSEIGNAHSAACELLKAAQRLERHTRSVALLQTVNECLALPNLQPHERKFLTEIAAGKVRFSPKQEHWFEMLKLRLTPEGAEEHRVYIASRKAVASIAGDAGAELHDRSQAA